MQHSLFWIGVLLTQLSGLCAALFFILFQSAVSGINPLIAVLVLFSFAAVFSVVFASVRRKKPWLKKWDKRAWLMLLGLAIAAPVGNVTMAISLSSTLASNVHLFQRTETIFAVLIGILVFSEKGITVLVGATLLFIIGIVTLNSDSTASITMISVLAGLLSGLSFATMQAFIAKLLPYASANFINALRLIASVMALLLIMPNVTSQIVQLPIEVFFVLALCGLIGPVVGRILYTYATRNIGIARAALFGSTSPIFTLILQTIVYGNQVSIHQIVGSIILLVAVTLPFIVRL